MMKLRQVHESARGLASQFRANVPMRDAIDLMGAVQPSHHEFWARTAVSIEGGNKLSATLPEVWPDALVSAVVAGEESGKMVDVLTRITKTVRIQLDLRKTFGKLIYPGGIAAAGLLIFIAIMVFIVPMSTRAFGGKRPDIGITNLALAMEAFFLEYWTMALIAIGGGIFAVVRWVQTESGKQTLLDSAMSVPMLGEGLKNLYFGLWAEYMALMFAAGIPIDRAVMLTTSVLPESLRTGFELFVSDLTVKSCTIQEAVDIKRMSENDPRREWPIFIRSALSSGHNTGAVDIELMAVAPELVDNGVAKVESFIGLANGVAIALAAALIGLSFIAIYLPIFASIQTAR